MEKKRAEIEQIDNGYIIRVWVEYTSGPRANSYNPVATYAVRSDYLVPALSTFFDSTILEMEEYINANQP